MKDKVRFSVADFSITIAVVVVLAVILLPVVSKCRVMQAGRCQSNMSRIAAALNMYLRDWNETYPTNRLNPPMNVFIAATVPLSDPGALTPSGDAVRYQNGVNWVEGLYAYIERVRRDAEPSMWKCPAATEAQYGGAHAAVTYALNANLVEFHRKNVKNSHSLMMVRELDRMYNSVLYPTTPTYRSDTEPRQPFLNENTNLTHPKYKLHEEGSHILFADGHVRYFPMSYFPTTCQWNAATYQWFNYVNLPAGDPRRLSIAVSP